MNIKVGKYNLHSDRFCFWITEDKVVEKGKTEGEIREERVAGYSTTVKTLLSSFVRKKIVDSDAESLEELLSYLSDLMDDIEQIDRVAFENDLRLVGQLKRTVEDERDN